VSGIRVDVTHSFRQYPRPIPRLPRRLECPDQDRSETRPPAVHHDEFEMGRVRGVLGEASREERRASRSTSRPGISSP
jgi:hypothetical protein